MKPTRYTFLTGFILFAGFLFSTFPSLAQKNKKRDKQEKSLQGANKEDDLIHLRIEKIENGKRNIYERTYRSGDSLDISEAISFSPNDSIISLKITRGFSKDSTYLWVPTGELFYNFDSNQLNNYNFSFNHHLDSLLEGTQEMMFKFNSEFLPNIDSLVSESLNATDFINKDLHKNFQFGIDSLFNHQNFNFHWNNDGFNFDGNNFNMMLDKDLYNIEEVEKDGKKIIKITPKEKKPKELPDKKKK